MNIKQAILIILTAVCFLMTSRAKADQVTISFPSSGDGVHSTLIICDKTIGRCEYVQYSNQDLEDGKYDMSKTLKAIRRLENNDQPNRESNTNSYNKRVTLKAGN